MNSGTSCRSELTPMGCQAYPSVLNANSGGKAGYYVIHVFVKPYVG